MQGQENSPTEHGGRTDGGSLTSAQARGRRCLLPLLTFPLVLKPEPRKFSAQHPGLPRRVSHITVYYKLFPYPSLCLWLNSFCTKTEPYAVPRSVASERTEGSVRSLVFSPAQPRALAWAPRKYSGPWKGRPPSPAWWPLTVNTPDQNRPIQSELKGLGSSSHRDGFISWLSFRQTLIHISAKSAWSIRLFSSSMFLLIFEWLICPRLRKMLGLPILLCLCQLFYSRPFFIYFSEM